MFSNAPDFLTVAPLFISIASTMASGWAIIKVQSSKIETLEQHELSDGETIDDYIERLNKLTTALEVSLARQSEVNAMVTKTLDSVARQVESHGTQITQVTTSLGFIIDRVKLLR